MISPAVPTRKVQCLVRYGCLVGFTVKAGCALLSPISKCCGSNRGPCLSRLQQTALLSGRLPLAAVVARCAEGPLASILRPPLA